MNLQKIESALRSSAADAWSILLTNSRSTGLFYTKGELETTIESRRDEARITVYRKYKDKLGDSSFSVHTDDAFEIKAQISKALALCSTAKKPKYPLAAPKASVVRLSSNDIRSGDWEKKLRLVHTTLQDNVPKGVRTAACELSLHQTTSTVSNSTGKRDSTSRTRFFIECPLIARSKGKELEFLATTSTLRLADFNAKKFITEHAKLARDVLDAKNFTGQNTQIVLSGDALKEFWSPDISNNPLVFHANARAKYMGLSKFSKRTPLGGMFTLYSNPLIDFNPLSSAFDVDGTNSRRVKVVEHGKWRQMIASNRYAHYLGIPVTGPLGSVELVCNNHALQTEGYVEIVSFSSFVPNGPSGDFSAEIRLGYLHKNGRRIPIRAAMFSGNLFRMLQSMAASKEQTLMPGYKGPARLFFTQGANVVGC